MSEILQSGNPAVTSVDRACPCCGGERAASFACDFEGILRCPECAFLFADPAKVSETPARYEEAFADHTRHPTYQKIDGEYVIRNARKLSRLLRRLERFRDNGRLLDVGCSAAFFLKLAEKHGWSPRGVEISAFGARFSREDLGLDVFHGTLDEAAYPDDFFDVVFSSHVMEHIGRPIELLCEMRRVLRPGGALVTIIPTQFSAPSYRIWKRLYGDGPPRHVSFYTRDSYRAFLRRAGFAVMSAHCNIELDRLRQLLRSGRVSDASEGSAGGSARKSTREYGMGVILLKSAINRVATLFDIGDELVVVATKPG